MLISLLGVGLLLMGVGYNPTPIASGVKYTQNNTTRNEKIEIQKNYEAVQPESFVINANTQLDSTRTVVYEQTTSVPVNPYLKTVMYKYKNSGYTAQAKVTNNIYSAVSLYGQNNDWDESTTAPTNFIYEQFYRGYSNIYDYGLNWSYIATEIEPYTETFNTKIDLIINLYIERFQIYDSQYFGTWYAVAFETVVFQTTADDYTIYHNLPLNNTIDYNYIYNRLNTPNVTVVKETGNPAIRFDSDGYPNTTGDYRNNRNVKFGIQLVPTKTNYIYTFIHPVIYTPTTTTNLNTDRVYTTQNTGINTLLYQPPNPAISGFFYTQGINYEVVDIPGLMWQILTMPFSFISTAFNLTLFPGTPYQINISNLFLIIFGFMVVVWILGRVKKFL